MKRRPKVVVVGGGLAGLAASCELADAGFGPTVVEKRPFLGGRAYSYTDKRTGMEVDNGQHVFLGCCTEYIRFLKKLDVFSKSYIQPKLYLPVMDKITGTSVITGSRLPSGLNTLPSFLRYRPLSIREKVLAAYALARIACLDRSKQPELDGLTFADWLRQHGQSENAIRSFWNPIIKPTLNYDVDRVSADLSAMVFQEGFLRAVGGANIGYAKVGLSALLSQAAEAYISDRGGRVQLGRGAKSLLLEGGRVTGLVLDNDRQLLADNVVFAVPPTTLSKLLPTSLRQTSFFSRTTRIEMAPIVNVHLWYDRSVVSMEFVAFVNSPMQWIFNKSKLWGQEGGAGQYLDISLSDAGEFMEMKKAEIIEMFKREMQAFFPEARTATVKRALVIKQAEATFAPKPGIASLRPCQQTPITGLFLSGDWTDTGWPATMESAVRSGVIAAQALVSTAQVDGKSEEGSRESEVIACQ